MHHTIGTTTQRRVWASIARQQRRAGMERNWAEYERLQRKMLGAMASNMLPDDIFDRINHIDTLFAFRETRLHYEQ